MELDIPFPNDNNDQLVGLAMSPSGTHAVVTNSMTSAFVLGFGEPSPTEREPNDSLAQAMPLFDRGVGWLDPDQTGAVTAAWSDADPRRDDFEDLWILPEVTIDNRLVVSVTPTSNRAPLRLALLDDTGSVIASVGKADDSPLALGNGLLLVPPINVQLPTPSFLALSVRDTSRLATGYELRTQVVSPIPEQAEQEDNDSIATAQSAVDYPVVINGTIDAVDEGSVTYGNPVDDFEDCYALRTSDTRLGVRLDPAIGCTKGCRMKSTKSSPRSR